MKQSLQPIIKYLSIVGRFISKHRVVLFIVVITLILCGIIYRISALSNTTASEDQVNEKIKELKIVKLDPAATKKISELRDLHIDLQTLFDPTRSNPFQ